MQPTLDLACRRSYVETLCDGARAAASVHLSTVGVGILHVAERSSMVYLTKSQRDSKALFLALPCRNCGCGIGANLAPAKEKMDGFPESWRKWY